MKDLQSAQAPASIQILFNSIQTSQRLSVLHDQAKEYKVALSYAREAYNSLIKLQDLSLEVRDFRLTEKVHNAIAPAKSQIRILEEYTS